MYEESSANKAAIVNGDDEEEDKFYDAGEEVCQNADNTTKVVDQAPPNLISAAFSDSNNTQNLRNEKENNVSRMISSRCHLNDISTEGESDDSTVCRKSSLARKALSIVKSEFDENNRHFDPQKPCCSSSALGNSSVITKRIEEMDSSDDSDLEVLSVRKTVQAICHNVADDDIDNAISQKSVESESTTENKTIPNSEECPEIFSENNAAEDSQDTATPTADSQASEKVTEKLHIRAKDPQNPEEEISFEDEVSFDDEKTTEAVSENVSEPVSTEDIVFISQEPQESEQIADTDDADVCEISDHDPAIVEKSDSETVKIPEKVAEEKSEELSLEKSNDNKIQDSDDEHLDTATENEVQVVSTVEPEIADKSEPESIIHPENEKMDIPVEDVPADEGKENVDDVVSRSDSVSVAPNDKQVLKEVNCDPEKIDEKMYACRVLLYKVDLDENVLRMHKVMGNLFPKEKVSEVEDELNLTGESEKKLSKSESCHKVRKKKAYFQSKQKNKEDENNLSESKSQMVTKLKRKRSDTDELVSPISPRKTPSKTTSKRMRGNESSSLIETSFASQSPESPAFKRVKTTSSRCQSLASPAPKRAETEELLPLSSTPSSSSRRIKSNETSRTSATTSPISQCVNSKEDTPRTNVLSSPISQRVKSKEISPRIRTPSPPVVRRAKTKEIKPRTPSPAESRHAKTKELVHSKPSSPVSRRAKTEETKSLTPSPPVSQREMTKDTISRTSTPLKSKSPLLSASRLVKTNKSSPRIRTPIKRQSSSSPQNKNEKIPEPTSNISTPTRNEKSSITQNEDSSLVKIFSLKIPVISLNRIQWPLNKKNHENTSQESVKLPIARRKIKFTPKRPRENLSSSEEELVQEKFSSDESDIETKKKPAKKKPKYVTESTTISKKDSNTENKIKKLKDSKKETGSRSKDRKRTDEKHNSDRSDVEKHSEPSKLRSTNVSDSNIRTVLATSKKSETHEQSRSVRAIKHLKTDEKQSKNSPSSATNDVEESEGTFGIENPDTKKDTSNKGEELIQSEEGFAKDAYDKRKDEKRTKKVYSSIDYKETTDKENLKKEAAFSDDDADSKKNSLLNDEEHKTENKNDRNHSDNDSRSEVDGLKKIVKSYKASAEKESSRSEEGDVEKTNGKLKPRKKAMTNEADSESSDEESIKDRNSNDSSDSYEEKKVISRKRQTKSRVKMKANAKSKTNNSSVPKKKIVAKKIISSDESDDEKKPENQKSKKKVCNETDAGKRSESSSEAFKVSESKSDTVDAENVSRNRSGISLQRKLKTKTAKANKTSQMKGKKLSKDTSSSDESEIESEKQNSKKKSTHETECEKSSASSDEDQKNKRNQVHSNSESSDPSDDDKEAFTSKNRQEKSEPKEKSSTKTSSAKDEKVTEYTVSSDNNEKTLVEQTVKKGLKSSDSSASNDEESKSKNQTIRSSSHSESNSDSDDEETSKTSKRSTKLKAEPKPRKPKSSSKGKKKNGSRRSIDDNLKDLVKLCGIHVKSFPKLWEGCRTYAQKSDRVLQFLKEKGFSGPLDKRNCTKFGIKRELDLSANVILSPAKDRRYKTRNSRKPEAEPDTSPSESAPSGKRQRWYANLLSDDSE